MIIEGRGLDLTLELETGFGSSSTDSSSIDSAMGDGLSKAGGLVLEPNRGLLVADNEGDLDFFRVEESLEILAEIKEFETPSFDLVLRPGNLDRNKVEGGSPAVVGDENARGLMVAMVLDLRAVGCCCCCPVEDNENNGTAVESGGDGGAPRVEEVERAGFEQGSAEKEDRWCEAGDEHADGAGDGIEVEEEEVVVVVVSVPVIIESWVADMSIVKESVGWNELAAAFCWVS